MFKISQVLDKFDYLSDRARHASSSSETVGAFVLSNLTLEKLHLQEPMKL